MKFKLVEAAESKICCICKKPFDGYGNNAEPVCSGSCCDECNMKEVIPARLKMLDNSSSEDIDEAVLNETNEFGEDEIDANCEKCGAIIKVPADFFDQVDDEGNLIDKEVICASCREKDESLNESNSVSSKIPPALDSFLQDIAQMYGTIDYGDIMDHDYTADDIRKLNNLRRRFITWAQYDEDDEEVKAKFNEIANKVAEILRSDNLEEAIDASKALEVKKNSDADIIFYGWQYKNEDPVEIDPEELTYEEYQARKDRIVSDYNKLYADKPQANRYAKEHDFMFYALYNRKNKPNEKDNNKMNEDISIRAKLKALYPELDFGDKVEEDLENAFDAEALDEEISEVEGQMSFFDDDMDFDIEEDEGIRRMNTLYNGADFDAYDDESIEESSDCEDDECWENDLISDDYDDGM